MRARLRCSFPLNSSFPTHRMLRTPALMPKLKGEHIAEDSTIHPAVTTSSRSQSACQDMLILIPRPEIRTTRRFCTGKTFAR